MCQRLYDRDARAASSSRCSPRRCRCSRRTSSPTRSSSGRGSCSTTAHRSTRRRSSTTVQRFMTYPGSPRAERLRQRRERHRRRPVHGRLPPEGSATRRFIAGNLVRPLADGARDGGRRLRGRTRSASARSCSTTASSATTSRVIKSPYYYDQERRLPRQDRLQADARRGGGGGGARGGRHPGARQRLDDRARRPSRQNSSLRVLQAPQLGWQGVVDQHRQQERRRQPAVPERRHAARVEPEAAAGLRGGDRPQRR